ncbi:MAG: hypothetical protein M1421_07015 [Candidatus Eremiobacteraeota bacterium]|nr:hypothetical protein [Candidatus Eremiobacteraeota bacterium]MCL5055724.1 hypothetical protein [Bacillota bacterium]
MGGLGKLTSPIGPNSAPPDFSKKPKTYYTGEDPTAKEVGKTQGVTVYTATQTGKVFDPVTKKMIPLPVSPEQQQTDLNAAHNILDTFSHDNQQIANDFEQKKITDFNVYVEPASPPTLLGGGYGASHPYPQVGEPKHYEDNITVNVNAPISLTRSQPSQKPFLGGPNEAPEMTDAEVVESYEDRTKNWNPGLTNGESLSRAIAFELQPAGAKDPNFSTKAMQGWWNSGHKDYINGNPDFIENNPVNKEGFQFDEYGGIQTKTQASDRNPNGYGAGTLFLFYLHSKLGYSWNKIIHAKGDTLGEKYQNLTGKSGKQGFQSFLHALPTKTLANGQTVLNLPPDGNPFQTKPNLLDKAQKAIAKGIAAVKNVVYKLWNSL